MIYLDTNIFVYAAINNGELGERCRKLIREIAEDKKAACTSTLTWDEVIYSIWKKEGQEKAIEEGRIFLQIPNILLLQASPAIIHKSQQLLESYLLKPRDAIHAATAITYGVKEILTDDSDFDRVTGLKRIKI